MKSRIFAICLAITAMVGANVYSQECATCSDVNPCSACATCKPCELFGGLKNLMSCRPCAECVVAAPVCAAPIAPACAPIAPACAPIEESCAPAPEICAPACAPRFRRLIDLFPRRSCGECGVCDTCAPVAPVCDVAPTCAPCEAMPVCNVGCAAPCLGPALVKVVRVPIVGARDALNGLFSSLADMTAPRCNACYSMPSCGACDDFAAPAPACGPISFEPSCNSMAAPAIPAAPAISTAPAASAAPAAALPASPAPAAAPVKTK